MEIKGLGEARLFEPDIFCPFQQRSLRGHMPPCCIYERGYHSRFFKNKDMLTRHRAKKEKHFSFITYYCL